MSNSDISVPSQTTAATCMIESTPVRMVRNLKKRQSNCDDVKRMQSNGLIEDSDDERKSSTQLLSQQPQAQQTLPPMGGFHRQGSSKPSTTSSASMKSFSENPADFSSNNNNSSSSKQSVSARQILDEAAKRSDHFSQQQLSQSQQQAPQQYKRRPQKTTQASSTLIQRKPSSQSQSDDNNSGDLPSATLSSNTSPTGNNANGDRDSTAAGTTVQQSQTFSSRIDSLRVSVPLKSMVSQSQQQQQQMMLQMQQQQEGPLGDKTNTLTEKRAFRRSKAKMPTTKDILATSGNSSTHTNIINSNNDGNNDFESPDEANQLQQYQRMASMGAVSSTANAMSIAEQHIKEYVNIDIDYAVHFLVSKSKLIKEILGGENAIVARNAQNVIDSRIFKITFGAFIQKQVHRKVLSQDFRNVSKRAFEKLEKFVMAQIEKQQTKASLQSTYVQSSKNVQSLFNQRIAALTKELADTKKLIFL